MIITYSVLGAGKRGLCQKYKKKVLELFILLSLCFYVMICKLVYTVHEANIYFVFIGDAGHFTI